MHCFIASLCLLEGIRILAYIGIYPNIESCFPEREDISTIYGWFFDWGICLNEKNNFKKQTKTKLIFILEDKLIINFLYIVCF